MLLVPDTAGLSLSPSRDCFHYTVVVLENFVAPRLNAQRNIHPPSGHVNAPDSAAQVARAPSNSTLQHTYAHPAFSFWPIHMVLAIRSPTHHKLRVHKA
jgi:hypothetical protein